MSNELPYRKARFAGSWYADDPVLLRQEIDSYLEAAAGGEDLLSSRIAVLPHAGLYYSGRGIARFFVNLPQDLRRVCILSPSHYTYLPNDTITGAAFSNLETPLKDLPYDPLCQGLPETMEECDEKVVKDEHAVEMFLPFIARASELLGHEIHVSIGLVSHFTSGERVHALADALIEAIGRDELVSGRTVIIASSDFTHYGERFGHIPYGIDDMEQILETVALSDSSYAQGFLDGSIEELIDRCREEHPTICGFAAALLASSIAHKLEMNGVIADQYTSNDLVDAPLPEFVSYCSVIWE